MMQSLWHKTVTHAPAIQFTFFLSQIKGPLPYMHSPMANPNTNITMLRDYRKGNWTLQETMVLIEAKKMDEERRTKGHGGVKTGGAGELRWKWVEDYCWRKGCLRSQNQCNDKWDNLMRDFKRVRDYHRRIESNAGNQSSGDHELKSYWEMEKGQRKERSLPSNMIKQVYDALVDVVERRSGGFKNMIETQAQTTALLLPTSNVMNTAQAGSDQPQSQSLLQHSASNVSVAQVQAQAQTILRHHFTNLDLAHAQPQTNLLQSIPSVAALPPPPPQLVGPSSVVVAEQPHCSMPLPTVDSEETSEHSDSPSRKRKKVGGEKEAGDQYHGGASTSTTNNKNNIVTEISKSAYLIAEAIQSCDQRQEARHKEILSFHQKSLQVEESKADLTKQGVHSLVDAINNLANSIFALANSKSI